MDILDSGTTEGLPPGMLETLKKSARDQQLRQIKRIQLLKKQASLAHEQQFLWAQKQHAEAKKMQMLEAEAEEKKRVRSLRRQEAEGIRKKVLEAVHDLENTRRRMLLKKLQEADRRADRLAKEKTVSLQGNKQRAAEVEARREQIKEKCQEVEERRRQEYIRKLIKMEAHANRIEETRRMEQEMQAEREEMKKQKLDEVSYRRELELQAKTMYYLKKRQHKEDVLEQRKQEQETMREEKLRESMRRQNTIASKVMFQTRRDDVERNRRMRKLEEKMSRADRLQEQRAQVLKALQEVRQEMSMQEQAFKEKLEKIERSGDFDKLDELDVDGMATQGVSAFLTALSPTSRPASAHPSVGRPSPRKNQISRESSLDISRFFDTPTDGKTTLTAASDDFLDPEENDTSWKEQQLREALNKEVKKEIERQHLLAQVQDPVEFQRLQKIFTMERKESMERIDLFRSR